MATNNESEAIFITIDNERIELNGVELDLFNANKNAIAEQSRLSKAKADAKIAARESALAKLAALGLTADEIAAL